MLVLLLLFYERSRFRHTRSAIFGYRKSKNRRIFFLLSLLFFFCRKASKNCQKLPLLLKGQKNGRFLYPFQVEVGRLIREDNKSFGKTTVFAYDTCGNILSKREYAFTLQETDEPEEMACTERLYAYDGDRLISYDGASYSYDALGNPLMHRGRYCSWETGGILRYYDSLWLNYDILGRLVFCSWGSKRIDCAGKEQYG